MRFFLSLLFLGLVSCQPQVETSYVDIENPFLMSTVESFRLAAREAMARKDTSALANEVFLLKRLLPVAWAAVVDSSGTVLMHSEPPAIATTLIDDLSQQSLGYVNPHQPLVRRLWSAEHRPVLDITLPILAGDETNATSRGYVRVGFFAGERAQNWAAPPSGAPNTRMEFAVEASSDDSHDPGQHAGNEESER